MTQLTVDPEFHALIPPLSADERTALEASLLAEGCRDALVVWNGVILDGHNRYEICQAHRIPFETIERAFPTRDHAIVWIVQNQMARRNISQYAKDEMVIEAMKPALERIGLARMKEEGRKGGTKGVADSATPLGDDLPPRKTDSELAKLADTSERGIRQSAYIAENAPEPIKEAAREGHMSRDRAYRLARALAPLPAEDRARAAVLCGDEPGKADVLVRLHKSMKHPDSNGTYEETLRTGGFHYGDELEKWCDFAESDMSNIERALKSLAEHHRRIAQQAKMAALVEQAERAGQPVRLYACDISDLTGHIERETVDYIITDPPYGKEDLPLYGELGRLSTHALKPGGSLLVMTGQSYLPGVIELLSLHIQYHWMLSYLTPGGQSAQLWERKVNTFWKPVLWFVKGKYSGQWVGDVARSNTNDNDKRFHEWGQSESGMADLMRRFLRPGDVVLDPFLGGGTTGVVALQMQCVFIGADKDAAKVTLSQGRIAEVVNGIHI